MKTYIVVIGEYKHHDYYPSYWNSNSLYTTSYRILAVDMDDARFRSSDFCNVLTESENKLRVNTYGNYSKTEDECIFKIVNIYDVDSLTEIV